MAGLVHSSSPKAGVPAVSDVTTLNTPGGMPALCPSSASASADRGVSSDGFSTTAHPAARAAATFLITRAAGKFQGVIRAHGPTGSLCTISCVSADREGISSPYARFASSENH